MVEKNSGNGNYAFSAERFIITTTGRAPSLLGEATTQVRFLGIWVSVWVGRSVAAVKPPQVVLPVAQITLTLGAFLSGRIVNSGPIRD